ncbi:GLPGLI family protein [Chitinophaga sp. GCM10012297]|uniref:GLPGLI family protein n=1 Tax=Chitinophaga chungangae TaxID=2821488 RepID=A0ABS3YE17_9BACT|nr:GLPGLI family protein [Chitinophaga chungangae]MBO9152925.1 GLPGLI family protein [Chitinophaga chungangae]
MKQIITAVFAATALLAAEKEAAAQQSGVIEYEVTARMDLSQARIVTVTSDGRRTEGAPEGGMPDMPNLITTKQTLTFSGGKGKLETEGGGGPRMMMMSSRGGNVVQRGNTVMVPDGAPSAGFAPGRPLAGNALRPPVSNMTYIDLQNRKYLTVTEERKDSVLENTWYSEEDYKAAAELKTSGKTKKIAGYSCRRATVTVGDEQFVLWYTTEIPVTFSPVNGVLPEQGVVLSIESSKRSYVAKKVELKPVPETAVSLPATAKKLTAEELKEKRRAIMEKWHNEQFKKMQEQIQ